MFVNTQNSVETKLIIHSSETFNETGIRATFGLWHIINWFSQNYYMIAMWLTKKTVSFNVAKTESCREREEREWMREGMRKKRKMDVSGALGDKLLHLMTEREKNRERERESGDQNITLQQLSSTITLIFSATKLFCYLFYVECFKILYNDHYITIGKYTISIINCWFKTLFLYILQNVCLYLHASKDFQCKSTW